MFWRIIGIASLGWGAVVFYILSTTPLPSSPEVPIYPGLELTVNILSIGWLVASSLVKVGLILKKHWTRVSIVSCICFIFLLINMGLVQASIQDKVPVPQDKSLYPYNLVVAWFVSWFWIDAFLIMIALMRWIIKRRFSG